MSRKKLNRKVTIISGIALITFSSLFFIASSNDDFKLVKSLEIYYSLFRELNLFYVDETNPEKLVENSINGMLKELDPYTTYIPETDSENFNFMTTGQYGGIGALIRRSGDYAIIAEPYEGFPANKAGLKAGDTIISIDGKPMINLEISKISDHLKGKPNTSLELVIRRYSHPAPIKKSIVREKITINNVPYYGMLNDHVGYIRLANFTTGAGQETKSALLELKKNPGLEGVVLDLRDNPGGLLIEAVDVANIFVKQGQEIVSTRGRVKQWDQVYRTRFMPVDTTIHVAVLVSRGSASASEIVAGSLQDLDRAVIIGQRTYGKGLVQTTRELSYNTRLKVTTAKYYIPSGRCIQALDYSNRNEDGSVGTIPDSLITEYLTHNGRKVYDGGGIQPDFTIDPQTLSKVAIALLTQSLIFDYATVFASRYDTIASIEEFEITDRIYNDFRAFVATRDFTYDTRSEESLKKLIETAKLEKYFDIANEEFSALEEKLAHDNEKDLNNFSEEIKQLMKEEIVVRYYFQKGRLQAILEKDTEVDKALEVFGQPSLYFTALGEKSADAEARSPALLHVE
jgi:carboxyl-terminal processing protease